MTEQIVAMVLSLALLAANPSSTNYILNNYDFGSGGVSDASSSNYRLNATSGTQNSSPQSGANYNIGTGNNNAQQANVPTITLQNTDNYYNKLRFTIGPQNNPSDAKFAIAISGDDFATTQYIQSDNTVGAALGAEDYKTYASWGGAGGALVVGLQPSTTYKVKSRAIRGVFTETGYGPVALAATVDPELSFDIDVAPTDTSTDPPFTLSLGDLLPGSVVTSTDKIWISLATNAEGGAAVYLGSQNAGLLSSTSATTITSATADLGSAASGYGIQSQSATQSSGGPFSAQSPYTGSSDNVGGILQSLSPLYVSTGPLSGGRASMAVKAKSAVTTPAGNDYQDILTLIAAGTF